MLRTAMLTIAFALAAAGAGAQTLPPQPPPVSGPFGGQASPEERAACHPDVTKFCQKQLDLNPDDVLGILGCLQSNRARISVACQEVLASHGQ